MLLQSFRKHVESFEDASVQVAGKVEFAGASSGAQAGSANIELFDNFSNRFVGFAK